GIAWIWNFDTVAVMCGSYVGRSSRAGCFRTFNFGLRRDRAPVLFGNSKGSAARSPVTLPRPPTLCLVRLGDQPADQPGQRSEQLVQQADQADHIVERIQDGADQIAEWS